MEQFQQHNMHAYRARVEGAMAACPGAVVSQVPGNAVCAPQGLTERDQVCEGPRLEIFPGRVFLTYCHVEPTADMSELPSLLALDPPLAVTVRQLRELAVELYGAQRSTEQKDRDEPDVLGVQNVADPSRPRAVSFEELVLRQPRAADPTSPTDEGVLSNMTPWTYASRPACSAMVCSGHTLQFTLRPRGARGSAEAGLGARADAEEAEADQQGAMLSFIPLTEMQLQRLPSALPRLRRQALFNEVLLSCFDGPTPSSVSGARGAAELAVTAQPPDSITVVSQGRRLVVTVDEKASLDLSGWVVAAPVASRARATFASTLSIPATVAELL